MVRVLGVEFCEKSAVGVGGRSIFKEDEVERPFSSFWARELLREKEGRESDLEWEFLLWFVW